MKVVIADKFEQSGIDGLRDAGCEVRVRAGPQGRRARGGDPSIRTPTCSSFAGTKVGSDVLDAGQLSLIVRAGAGYNTIDVAAASARGIYVSNCPGKNAIAVAELAFALILALDRRVPDNVAELRAGRWNKKEFSKAQGLYGRTLGAARCRQHRPGNDSARRRLRHERRRLEPALRRTGSTDDRAGSARAGHRAGVADGSDRSRADPG